MPIPTTAIGASSSATSAGRWCGSIPKYWDAVNNSTWAILRTTRSCYSRRGKLPLKKYRPYRFNESNEWCKYCCCCCFFLFIRHFTILKLIACFILPIVIPVYCWNEEWIPTILSQWFIRYAYCLNVTWSVNSFAHFWGSRDYDKWVIYHYIFIIFVSIRLKKFYFELMINLAKKNYWDSSCTFLKSCRNLLSIINACYFSSRYRIRLH